jgi:hypothetical protein
VEGAARVVDLVGGRRRHLRNDRLPHHLEILLAAPHCSESRDLGLESEARLETLADVVEPDLRNEEPSVDFELDEAVACEAAKRLAHRSPRDAETVGQLALAEPRAGGKRPCDDQ